MKHEHMRFCLINLIALFLGGICVYIYIPFVGYGFSFFMEQELYRQIQSTIINFGKIGIMIFKIFHFLQDAIFLFIVCIPALYFFAEKLRKQLPYSLVFLLVGALIGDYYLYFSASSISFPQNISFSYSIFFGTTLLSYLWKLCVLGSVFYISIMFGMRCMRRIAARGLAI